MEDSLSSMEGTVHRMTEPDHVARIMGQWQRERPDLDVSPQALIGRLHRLADALNDELDLVYQKFGVGDGEFDVLATLRRSGPPFELTPGALCAGTMVSSGAVTKRVDRLCAAGLVSRRVSDHDARSRVVKLTARGRSLIDRAFTQHIANEHRLVAAFTERERAQLAGLLEKWGRALDAATTG
jgi:DNA-binding MarR family transcriptional regulator